MRMHAYWRRPAWEAQFFSDDWVFPIQLYTLIDQRANWMYIWTWRLHETPSSHKSILISYTWLWSSSHQCNDADGDRAPRWLYLVTEILCSLMSLSGLNTLHVICILTCNTWEITVPQQSTMYMFSTLKIFKIIIKNKKTNKQILIMFNTFNYMYM